MFENNSIRDELVNRSNSSQTALDIQFPCSRCLILFILERDRLKVQKGLRLLGKERVTERCA